MTTNFYAPPSRIREGRVTLPAEETRHARSVLRVQVGDTLTVVDGEGGWYRVEVTHASGEQLVGRVAEKRTEVGEPAIDVTVGIGLLKKRARFETFAEKAVELGACRLVPLRTRHTETDTLRTNRVRKVMRAALKQCRRSRLPTLAEPIPIDALLRRTEAPRRFVCHGSASGPPLQAALQGQDATEPVLVLVGPEGGLHDDEMTMAIDAGCTPVSLGPRRLRAETAGIVAVHAAVQAGGEAAAM